MRAALDYFRRSFVPETQHASIGVLDTAGNVMLRIGKYGNVDDGIPMRNADRGLRNEDSGTGGHAGGPGNPQSEIPNPRSIGGDEVALFYAPFLGVHSDRRLFVADSGNQRLLSIKLGYHAEERIALERIN